MKRCCASTESFGVELERLLRLLNANWNANLSNVFFSLLEITFFLRRHFFGISLCIVRIVQQIAVVSLMLHSVDLCSHIEHTTANKPTNNRTYLHRFPPLFSTADFLAFDTSNAIFFPLHSKANAASSSFHCLSSVACIPVLWPRRIDVRVKWICAQTFHLAAFSHSIHVYISFAIWRGLLCLDCMVHIDADDAATRMGNVKACGFFLPENEIPPCDFSFHFSCLQKCVKWWPVFFFFRIHSRERLSYDLWKCVKVRKVFDFEMAKDEKKKRETSNTVAHSST